MFKTDDEKAAALDELYAELPTIECQGHCHTSCGPIDMSSAERERIRKVTGVHIQRGSFLRDGPSDCVALTMLRRCGVYDVRPLICRLYGVTKRLPCGYGCRPSRYLTEPEAYGFLARAFEIAGEREVAAVARRAADPGNQQQVGRLRDQLDAETYRRWAQ